MSSPLFRHEAVVVVWLDAHARSQAVEYTEDEVINLHRPEEVITLGLLLKEDQNGVSLYCENTGPDAIRGANFIPAAMIKEIIRLGSVKRPRKPQKKHAKEAISVQEPAAKLPQGVEHLVPQGP